MYFVLKMFVEMYVVWTFTRENVCCWEGGEVKLH